MKIEFSWKHKKFTKSIELLPPWKCLFFFYKVTGSRGVYSVWQSEQKFYCIPFVIGIRYGIDWG